MKFEEQINEYLQMIEPALDEALGDKRNTGYDGLLEGMYYSLMAGGKRVRPILTLEFCRICGGDVRAALPLACAVEMMHTYTLIHDDLPCMDNDDTRRGQAANHIAYGYGNAVLAGDALQAEAFSTLLCAPLPPQALVDCAKTLAHAAGADGVCAGQYLDLNPGEEKISFNDLADLDLRKTGALLNAACMMGVIAAGGSDEQRSAAAQFSSALGLAFQMRDDVLDATQTTENLGKTSGSDERDGKVTFATLFGAEGCEGMIDQLGETAIAALDVFEDTGILPDLTRSLAARQK